MSNKKTAWFQNYAKDMKEQTSFTNYYKFADGRTTIRLLPPVNSKGELETDFEILKPFYETRLHKLGDSNYLYCPKWEREKGSNPDIRSKQCPICDQAKRWYDAKKDDQASQIYQKKKYYFNVLVRGDEPLSERVHQVEFGPQVFKQLESMFQDEEVGADLFSVNGGIDINVEKTQQGEFPVYKISAARKTSDLVEKGEDVQVIIDKIIDFHEAINYKSVDEIVSMVNTYVASVGSAPVSQRPAKETLASTPDDLDSVLDTFEAKSKKK